MTSANNFLERIHHNQGSTAGFMKKYCHDQKLKAITNMKVQIQQKCTSQHRAACVNVSVDKHSWTSTGNPYTNTVTRS